MVSKLMSSENFSRNNKIDGRPSHAELRRILRVEGALYDVLIAGQLSTGWGWVPHEVEYTAQDPWRPNGWENMLQHAQDQTKNRTIVHSKNRYLGLAPKVPKPVDYIFSLFGLQEPAILRKQEDESHIFVGTAYVH